MRIEVAGRPAPQGSKRHVGHGIMLEMSKAVGPWREAVRAETQRACGQIGHAPLPAPGEPVVVDILFQLPRPKSAPKRVLWPARRPDLDKLVRAVLDGIVAGGALADDAQIVCMTVVKRFGPPGCLIEIEHPEVYGIEPDGAGLWARMDALEQAEMAARDALTERTGR